MGSKHCNLYCVTSSNEIKLCDFKWCSIDSYGHVSIIYNILSHDIPISVGTSRFMHICSISSYFFKPKQMKEDCLIFIPVSHW